jgi:hypothetical protein
MGSNYTTAQKVKNYMQITNFNHAGVNLSITDWIIAASDWIDNYCGRTFTAETSTKVYDGQGKYQLVVDDFTTITRIETLDEDGAVDEYTTDKTDWYTYPVNTKPKHRVDLNRLSNDFMGAFPSGQQNIKIYADWGFESSVPKTIELVCTMLVSELVKNNDQQTTNMDSESLGDYSVSYGDIDRAAAELGAKEMLDQYLRFWI